jgi:hypothetical protein
MFENTLGLVLPRSAAQQAAATEKIDSSELKPGDLVFFNTMRRTFSHVGIYVGNGKFILSPRPGAEVRVEDMGLAYWSRRSDGARRASDRRRQIIIRSRPRAPPKPAVPCCCVHKACRTLSSPARRPTSRRRV